MSTPRKLGFWSATSLVMGNMIGSGIYLLPVSLAAFGWLSLPAWAIAATGALLLAFLFRNLSKHHPQLKGGPYAYTRLAFGDFAAFLVAWGYWISIWTTNAAIAVAFVSYASALVPALAGKPFWQLITALMAVWLLTWVNTRRVIVSGRVQTWSTILKIIPLAAVGVYGLFHLHPEWILDAAPQKTATMGTLTEAVVLALFAFLGLESATIPTDQIKDAKHLIPRATLTGTGIAILLYILSSTVVQGLIPPEQLIASGSPFAEAARLLWGEGSSTLVALGALISAFGALNGWILLQGQIPAAAAEDGVFPRFFAKRNRFNMPVAGLLVSSVLVSLMVALNFTENLVDTFAFILLLSTLMALLPYLFTTASGMLLSLKEVRITKRKYKWLILNFLGFLFVLWAIYGAGKEVVFYGFILLLCGIPGYVWIKSNTADDNKNMPK